MIIRNKLGTFEFDDNVYESHAKLIANGVMGQYFNPKRGEPPLSDEASCYEFVRERFGQVLSMIGFDLEINENVYQHAPVDPLVELIKFQQEVRDAKIKNAIDGAVKMLKNAFPGSYLVGPESLA